MNKSKQQQDNKLNKQTNTIIKLKDKTVKGGYYISQFCKPLDFLQYHEPEQNTIIINLQKKVNSVICQYGPNNQKASKIVVSYVQKLKDKAQENLKSHQKQALAYYAKALSFKLPSDKTNHIKMIILKINMVLRMFHVLFPAPQAQMLIRHVIQLLNTSQHIVHSRKNFDFNEQMVRFIMGYIHYKQGDYTNAINSNKKAKQSIQIKLQMIAKSKKNDTQEDRILQTQQVDLVKLIIKVCQTISKCHKKMGYQKQALDYIQQAFNKLKIVQLGQFYILYLQKKQDKVRAFFQTKKHFNQIPLISYKNQIEVDMPKIIEEARTNNQNLHKYNYSLNQMK